MTHKIAAGELKLYHYWRSSSSWRVRWAFAYKGIPCEFVAVDLLSGEAENEAHRKRNPMGFVPVLEFKSSGEMLTESLAIIGWAEEMAPTPSLFGGSSASALTRARIRRLAETINAGTQPLQNLSTLIAYSDDTEARKKWAQRWIIQGFEAYEFWAKQTAGIFSVGDQLSVADLCLVPQIYNAARFDISLDPFPTIARIYGNAIKTESYQASVPEKFQP